MVTLTDTPGVHLETIEGLPHPDDGASGGLAPEMMRSKGPVIHLIHKIFSVVYFGHMQTDMMHTSLCSPIYSMPMISLPMNTNLSTQLY